MLSLLGVWSGGEETRSAEADIRSLSSLVSHNISSCIPSHTCTCSSSPTSPAPFSIAISAALSSLTPPRASSLADLARRALPLERRVDLLPPRPHLGS